MAIALIGLLAGCWGGSHAPELMVIGVDGLGPRAVEKLSAAGRLPNISALARQGIFAEVRTVTPVISPIIWTSIASGKRAAKHGVSGWYATADDGSQRVVDARDVKVRRYWEILDERGVACATISWLALFPIVPTKGLTVASNLLWDKRFSDPKGDASRDIQKLTDHAVAPRSAVDWIMPKRPLVADAKPTSIGYQLDHTPLADHPFIRDRWALSVAEESLRHGEPDVLSVYLKGVDELAHLFLPFTDAEFERQMRADLDAYANLSTRVPMTDMPWEGESLTNERISIGARVVDDYSEWLDGEIGKLLAKRGPKTNVILVSDHGMTLADPISSAFGPGFPRPDHTTTATLILAGPAFVPGATLRAPSVMDVAPTVLHALGHPVARDMDGRVLVEAFAEQREVQWVDTFDATPRALPSVDDFDQSSEIERLKQLGYVQ